ncbi:hypothetical protein Purlil1_2132 [Purpureocillium lilacinum]|uniref:Uncharacterized protein n=1 Tax=Purpureocillium lilacinum TaxID=33203 RepID=A0ABR0CDL6_PURLI|nr:hypothetical protein Purlil1_2132 [Purpureocillium lilacinum]
MMATKTLTYQRCEKIRAKYDAEREEGTGFAVRFLQQLARATPVASRASANGADGVTTQSGQGSRHSAWSGDGGLGALGEAAQGAGNRGFASAGRPLATCVGGAGGAAARARGRGQPLMSTGVPPGLFGQLMAAGAHGSVSDAPRAGADSAPNPRTASPNPPPQALASGLFVHTTTAAAGARTISTCHRQPLYMHSSRLFGNASPRVHETRHDVPVAYSTYIRLYVQSACRTTSQHGPVTSFTRPHISCQDSNTIASHSTARDARQTRQAAAAPAAALLTTNDPIFPTRLFHHFRKHVRAMVSNAVLPPPPRVVVVVPSCRTRHPSPSPAMPYRIALHQIKSCTRAAAN